MRHVAGQLSELLFSLQHELGPGPYDILGTSMGGAIATFFANTVGWGRLQYEHESQFDGVVHSATSMDAVPSSR